MSNFMVFFVVVVIVVVIIAVSVVVTVVVAVSTALTYVAMAAVSALLRIVRRSSSTLDSAAISSGLRRTKAAPVRDAKVFVLIRAMM
jgi:5-bromo-4-chloroindolyl phosphate hydrolysis protein